MRDAVTGVLAVGGPDTPCGFFTHGPHATSAAQYQAWKFATGFGRLIDVTGDGRGVLYPAGFPSLYRMTPPDRGAAWVR